MSAFLLTQRAREDVEQLVRRISLAGPRTARRALDEVFASMDWLAGRSGPGLDDVHAHAHALATSRDVHEAEQGIRVWPVRDALLVWRPADDEDDRPAVLLRVLRRT
ncbi:MAG: type II toxin-antitoxin system RelE/ParE family toxin [Planctomycetota bacterium]|jgi:plasmid stabilization system protein ParE